MPGSSARRDLRRLLLSRVGAARRGLPAPRPVRRRRRGPGRLRPARGRRPDAHVLPVLGPRRARRRGAGRHRGCSLGPRRQGARPSRPSVARPRVADQPPRVCHGRALAVAEGRPAPQGRVLPRAGVPGRQADSGYLDSASRDEVPTNGVQAAVDTEVGKATLLRDTFGAEAGLLLDGRMGHREGQQRSDIKTAGAVLHALEPFGLTFFEEPLRYDDVAGYAELTRSTTIPIAGSEQPLDGRGVRRLPDRDAFAVAQPDAAWLGIDGFVQVATQFGQNGRQVAPHAWSGVVGVMQNVHAAFACPNTLIVEIPPAAGPLHAELWAAPSGWRPAGSCDRTPPDSASSWPARPGPHTPSGREPRSAPASPAR